MTTNFLHYINSNLNSLYLELVFSIIFCLIDLKKILVVQQHMMFNQKNFFDKKTKNDKKNSKLRNIDFFLSIKFLKSIFFCHFRFFVTNFFFCVTKILMLYQKNLLDSVFKKNNFFVRFYDDNAKI